ncbi:Gfo/Idh/MocA family protein [Candidatus Pelagibacter communis]|uniref:Gfo/Idh/MocA family protein n=1 Tax=Pelagibacter ubique TaxID=198252 RepID=UPI00092CF339|nr:Gfo/Idh/MocA family oxidoreductase [Candidatus Pelagibacter ubique]
MKSKKLKLGIIGGGPNSWIGHVHRISSRFDDKYEIVAGVFSRNSKQSTSFGKSIGVSEDRCYSNYLTMANKESLRKDKIDVVSIMTPPGSHQIIAEKFIDKNIHIISDKPFAADLKQAKSLFNKIKKNKKIKYALTHNYSAYPMVREAKVLIEKGKIGKVEDVNFEYVQDWSEGKTINKKNSRKMFRWKLDNKIVGVSTVLNELGSHACHLASYMSGLKTKKVFADITQVSKTVKMDNNAKVLIEFDNGAKGMFWTSCTARGGVYGLRIRIFGSKGSLEWIQNDPTYLKFNPSKGAVRILERGFHDASFSKKFSRIKFGHPEGYLDAFSNIYREFAESLKSKKRTFYPNEDDGYETAKFINACKKSSESKKWVKL